MSRGRSLLGKPHPADRLDQRHHVGRDEARYRGAPTVDHLIPGLAANPSTSGRLAIAYHEIPDNCVNVAGCRGIDIFQQTSSNGGATWSKPQRITAESMNLAWLPRTSLGLMLGDYVSTSYVGARPVSVVVIAASRVGSVFRGAAFAYRPRG